MGMFFCDNCKSERGYLGPCQFCGTQTRKYWWSFPAGTNGKHDKAPHGFKVFYDTEGKPVKEEEY